MSSNHSDHSISDDIHREIIYHESEDKAHEGLNTKVIWKVFWILLFVTMFEVGISFTPISKEILLYTFVLLTGVKAYYIIFFFMHMKFEKMTLKSSILLPFLLIAYLIFIALYEGVMLGLTPY